MKRVQVKICGLTSAEAAAAAVAAGADYVGVVLVPGRLRSRTVAQAAEVFSAGAGRVRVGVFADAPPDDVLAASAVLRLDAVQLHGTEPVAVLEWLRVRGAPRLWKALAAGGAGPEPALLDAYAAVADAIVLDGAEGGRGIPFAWAARRGLRDRLPPAVQLVVAGGLRAENVAEALAALDPDVVDVSSGVEATPGVKSAQAMRAFVAAVRRAQAG